jgi:hypothetical protein
MGFSGKRMENVVNLDLWIMMLWDLNKFSMGSIFQKMFRNVWAEKIGLINNKEIKMNPVSKGKVVVMVPAESIEKIIADHPEVELQIADRVIEGSAKAIIKKAMNDKDAIVACRKKAEEMFDLFIKDIGLVSKKVGWDHRLELSDSIKKNLMPYFTQYLQEVSEEYLKTLEGTWEQYLELNFKDLIRKRVQSEAEKLRKEIREETTKEAKGILEQVMRDKFGMSGKEG